MLRMELKVTWIDIKYFSIQLQVTLEITKLVILNWYSLEHRYSANLSQYQSKRNSLQVFREITKATRLLLRFLPRGIFVQIYTYFSCTFSFIILRSDYEFRCIIETCKVYIIYFHYIIFELFTFTIYIQMYS